MKCVCNNEMDQIAVQIWICSKCKRLMFIQKDTKHWRTDHEVTEHERKD